MPTPPEMDKFLARRSYTRRDLTWFKYRVDGIPCYEQPKTAKGTNTVIVRTKAGMNLIDAAEEAGYLTITREVVPREFDSAQEHHKTKKEVMRARCDGMLAEGRLTPRTVGLRLDTFAADLSPEEYERQKQGTRERLRNGRNTEPEPKPRTS